MKNLTIKVAGFTAACFLISYGAAKVAGIAKYPDDLGRKYMLKLHEGHEVSLDQEILIEGVEEIEVETVSSDIHIAQQRAKEFQGKMRAKFTGPDTLGFNTLRAGNKLYLKIAKKGEKSNWNLAFDDDANELALELPEQVKNVVVKTVSGNVEAADAEWANLTVASTSGDLNWKKVSAKEFDGKTVSGDIRCEECRLDEVRASTTSGDVSLLMSNELPQISVGTTSGDIELRFEKKPGAKLEFASVSGELALDPAFGKADPDARRASVVVGSGKGHIALKTTSGDVRVGLR